jgi:hypothetical protein
MNKPDRILLDTPSLAVVFFFLLSKGKRRQILDGRTYLHCCVKEGYRVFCTCPDRSAAKRQGGPVKGREASGHGEIVKRHQVPIDGSKLACHGEIVSVRAKNEAPAHLPSSKAGSADSANDAVPGDETVGVPLDLINYKDVKGIDFRIDREAVLALAKAIN